MMKKKIMTAILMIGLIFSISSITSQATVINGVPGKTKTLQEKLDKAGDIDFSSATQINIMNCIMQDSITETTKERLYKFTLPSVGRITLNMTSYMQYYTISIYDSVGAEIWHTYYNEWNSSLQYRNDIHEVDLIGGVYYIKVTGNYGEGWSSSTGRYVLKTAFLNAKESFGESNNEFNKAVSLNVNSTITGQIAQNDDKDIFKLSLSTSGCMNLDITSFMRYYTITIYDEAGHEKWKAHYNEWNENLKKRQDFYNVDLSKGTYYMKITGYYYDNNNYSAFSTGTYVLKSTFISANESFQEPNNDFMTATSLQYNTSVTGQIAINDDIDNFILNVSSDTEIKISITSYMKYYTLVIFDSAGKTVWDSKYNQWNEDVGYRSDEHRVTLKNGKYFLKVTGYWNGQDGLNTGIYQMKISQLSTISQASTDKIKDYAYIGKYIKPSVTVRMNGNALQEGIDYVLSYKNNYYIGTATVYINGIGDYTGEIQTTFNIVPKKVSLSSVKNNGKKKATVKWKYDNNATGYQIYHSTKKSSGYKRVATVKRSTTSKAISKLKKGKKYYFKVRAYKIVGEKKYYGEFSKVKSVKIKK